MGVTLTHQQQAAVDNRGGELLVSAAAGSGKTRILVERLLNRVQQEHLDLDRFLVITYTKAAAAELRGKIMDELNDRLAADPGNAFLHRQKLVIYRAQISTIHSFCTALMREEGYRIDLQPDFRVGDDSECAVLKNRILTRALEERYEHLEENSAFSELVDTLSAGRDDSRLQSIVLDIHTRIQSHPAPARWLADQARAFDLSGVKDVGATAWGRLLMENARRQAAYWHRRFVEVLDLLREDAALEKAYAESFDGTAGQPGRFPGCAGSGLGQRPRPVPDPVPKAGPRHQGRGQGVAGAGKIRPGQVQEAPCQAGGHLCGFQRGSAGGYGAGAPGGGGAFAADGGF